MTLYLLFVRPQIISHEMCTHMYHTIGYGYAKKNLPIKKIPINFFFFFVCVCGGGGGGGGAITTVWSPMIEKCMENVGNFDRCQTTQTTRSHKNTTKWTELCAWFARWNELFKVVGIWIIYNNAHSQFLFLYLRVHIRFIDITLTLGFRSEPARLHRILQVYINLI